jgi:hypothetical protein
MNNNLIIVNLTRFIALFLMQVLIFKRIALGWSNFNYVNIFIYPVFMMLLPAEIPAAIGISISFLLGLSIDAAYDSMGVHAGACVFSAYLRYYVLGLLEPKGGYPLNSGPTQYKLGVTWFLQYSTLFLFLHLFIYFSILYFSFVYIGSILISTFFSFIFSMIFIVMYQFLLDPKE